MTAQHSHRGVGGSGIGKLAARARENLHWVAILLWAVVILATLAPLL